MWSLDGITSLMYPKYDGVENSYREKFYFIPFGNIGIFFFHSFHSNKTTFHHHFIFLMSSLSQILPVSLFLQDQKLNFSISFWHSFRPALPRTTSFLESSFPPPFFFSIENGILWLACPAAIWSEEVKFYCLSRNDVPWRINFVKCLVILFTQV